MNAIERAKIRKQQANYCRATEGTCQKYEGERITRCIAEAEDRYPDWNCKCPYSNAEDCCR